ncbi:TPA: AAA family ATPase [Bacillus cereus]|nr:AAA family ATPase [Bacillus cereus]
MKLIVGSDEKMEFCYYWIDEYNDFLKGQGFNFGGEYIFEYKVVDNKLIIKKNENYIRNFFNTQESGNISNVSAIVGRNGVGKSTIIEAMKGLLLDGGILGKKKEEDYYFYKRILVIKEGNQYKIFIHKDLLSLDRFGQYNIEYHNMEEKYIDRVFTVIIYGDLENTHQFKTSRFVRVYETEIFQDTMCVYFSTVFDSNPYYYYTMPEKSYFDLSNMGILNRLNKKQIEFKNMELQRGIADRFEQKDLRFGTSTISQFSTEELEAKIMLLQDSESKKVISEYMSFPEKLILDLDYILYKAENFSFFDEDSENLLRCELESTKLYKIEKLIYEKIKKLISDGSEKSIAKSTLYYRIIDAYFTDVNAFVRFQIRQENIKMKLEDIKDDSYIDFDIIKMLNVFQETILKMNEDGELDSNNEFREFYKFNRGEFLKLHNGYVKLIDFFERNIQNNRISFQKGTISLTKMEEGGVKSSYISDMSVIEITLDNEGLQLASELIKIYRKLYTIADFIRFSWAGISSGENALFSMLSRFHLLREHIIEKNMVIFFDEGELCLHPEWQRKYIDIITSYVQRIFSNAKNIQIVFSTNSPLLISDIPNRNIIFLDRFKDGDLAGKCKVVENSEFPQTFAANIHNLMINGFFMESTMGEFSAKKIKDVISLLQQDVQISIESALDFIEKSEEISGIIKLIGEPIVRKKLNQMFMDKKERSKKRVFKSLYDSGSNNDIDELKKIRSIIEEQISNLEDKGN